MAFVISGDTITEFSKEIGPEGKRLKGDGETGLASHREAVHSAKGRRDHVLSGGTVGFADTPEVEAAFESLHQHAADKAEEKEGAGDGDPETAADGETADEPKPKPKRRRKRRSTATEKGDA